ncbi:MAG TPA: alpha/beta fold hydrolase [Thermoanaerobaculia bacterium]
MKFTIASDENLPIHGVLHLPPSPRALVVMVHGFKGFKDWNFFPWLAEDLERNGYAVCRFDMSRSGIGEQSDWFEHLDLFADDTYTTQLADLRKVLELLDADERLHDLPIVLFGHSRGGAIAILGAALTRRLGALVTWSSIANCDRWDDATKEMWRRVGHMEILNQRTKQVMGLSTKILDDFDEHRYDVTAAMRAIDVPMLIVHGTADETVPSIEAEELTSEARNAHVVLIDGGTHTYGAAHPLVTIPRALREAADATLAFLARLERNNPPAQP